MRHLSIGTALAVLPLCGLFILGASAEEQKPRAFTGSKAGEERSDEGLLDRQV